MLWIIITVLCGVAIGFRIYTLSGRPQVWWIAFTATLVFIVPGAALLMNESAVNATLGITNIALLASNLCFIGAAGSVQVFVHSLRSEVPSRRWIALHLTVAVAVATIVTVGWLLAPIHSVAYPELRFAPFSPQMVLYIGVFHVYLGFVLANVAVCAATLIRATPRHDPGRRVGLVLVAFSASLDVVAHLLYLVHMILAGSTRDGVWAARVAAVVTLVAMTGIVFGTVTFVVAPALVELRNARRLITQLTPLWARVRELDPGIALPGAQSGTIARAERMVIEITDGLSRLAVDPLAAERDPYGAVAASLVHPNDRSGPPGSLLATAVLPAPTQRHDEEDVLVQLAAAYLAARRDYAHAS